MDIAKTIFETIDKVLDKSQNDNVEIENIENIEVLKDLKYIARNKDCVLDCYFDKTIKNKKFPVIFYIHGGGFLAGGKEFRRGIATWFASFGFFVVNVDYGLSPNCVFPKQIKHLISALNWTIKNAERFNLDLKKIVLAGDSAGAYFASMLACTCQSEDLQNKFKAFTDASIYATILNCGLYDMKSVLEKRMPLDLNGKIFESYTGIKKDEVSKYKFKDSCSPLSLINANFAPTFLIYAEKDLFCEGQAERMIEQFDKNNIYFESFKSTSILSNHCFSLEWKGKAAEKANALLVKFLEKIKNDDLPRHQSDTTIYIREEE